MLAVNIASIRIVLPKNVMEDGNGRVLFVLVDVHGRDALGDVARLEQLRGLARVQLQQEVHLVRIPAQLLVLAADQRDELVALHG